MSSNPLLRRLAVSLTLGAALAALAAFAVPVHAGTGYSLHVRISKAHGGKAVDVALPWDLARGGSPFDFISDSGDRPELERLRAAWGMLAQMPEGKAVIIHSERGRTRAWRQSGNLVLEPLDEADDQDLRDVRIKVPGPVIEAVLRRDGRLRTDDLEALLRSRGEIGLVDVDSNRARVKVWIDRDPDSGLQ